MSTKQVLGRLLPHRMVSELESSLEAILKERQVIEGDELLTNVFFNCPHTISVYTRDLSDPDGGGDHFAFEYFTGDRLEFLDDCDCGDETYVLETIYPAVKAFLDEVLDDEILYTFERLSRLHRAVVARIVGTNLIRNGIAPKVYMMSNVTKDVYPQPLDLVTFVSLDSDDDVLTDYGYVIDGTRAELETVAKVDLVRQVTMVPDIEDYYSPEYIQSIKDTFANQ